MSTSQNTVHTLINYVQTLTFDDLNDDTKTALKTFILDSLGVGICGARVPFASKLKLLCQSWGEGKQAQVFNTGEWMPAPSAAMLNAWQIHNQEFDCVHEQAVVHPMAVILASVLAYCQKAGNIDGKTFMTAISAAVDVATTLGSATRSPLTFFRPAWCGALGSTLAIAKLAKLDTNTTANALGITYSMLGGTMQAHVEGTSMLAMQIGIAARSTLNAIDMAMAGLDAPQDVIDGPFGFFSLIERESDIPQALAELRQQARINQVSHKPFPTGRACHGGLDALRCLVEEHQFSADDIDTVTLSAPPLINRLIGRRPKTHMAVSYARLCFGYTAASLMLDGDVRVDCYDEDKLYNRDRLALAERFNVVNDGSDDPNAMTPQTLTVNLKDGKEYQFHLPATLGSPERPLSREQHLQKFRQCCLAAPKPLAPTTIESLISQVDNLQEMCDVSVLVQQSQPQ